MAYADELYYSPAVYGRKRGASGFAGGNGPGGGVQQPIWERLGMNGPYGPGETMSPGILGMARSAFGLPGAGAGFRAPKLDPTRAQGAGYSIDTDPVLQQIIADSMQNVSQAEADAQAGKEKALIQFGDPALAAQILGKNSAVLKSVSSDPDKGTSILARLNRTYRDRVSNDNEQINQGNLWYGGYHGKVLANDAKDKATDTADATSNVNNALSQIGATLLAAKTAAAQNTAMAEAQAAAAAQNDPSGYYSAGGSDPNQRGATPAPVASEPAAAPIPTGYDVGGSVGTPGSDPLHGGAGASGSNITDALIAAALTARRKQQRQAVWQ